MQHLLGYAAEESMLQGSLAVRAHNDNIDLVTLCRTKYLRGRMAVDDFYPCNIFQVFRMGFQFIVSKGFQPLLQVIARLFFMLLFKRFKFACTHDC